MFNWFRKKEEVRRPSSLELAMEQLGVASRGYWIDVDMKLYSYKIRDGVVFCAHEDTIARSRDDSRYGTGYKNRFWPFKELSVKNVAAFCHFTENYEEILAKVTEDADFQKKLDDERAARQKKCTEELNAKVETCENILGKKLGVDDV